MMVLRGGIPKVSQTFDVHIGGNVSGQVAVGNNIVQIGSVTLGSGKPLLPRQITSPSLRLISVQQFGTGFAELRYELPTRATQTAG